MSDMADVIAAHTPTRWRSFTNDNVVLRCCGTDFGNATKKPNRGDEERAQVAHAAHVADELTKAGFGSVQDAKRQAWDEGYVLGVDDHRTSLEYSSNDFGIPGNMPVAPARVNPYESTP